MLWIKAFHLMAMVTWFAGIFYLPRLFVYHAMTEDESGRERFRIMERKLYRGIMNPSMIATLIFGTWLIALNPGYYLQQGWLHIKLLLIAVLVAYHLWCGYFVRLFQVIYLQFLPNEPVVVVNFFTPHVREIARERIEVVHTVDIFPAVVRPGVEAFACAPNEFFFVVGPFQVFQDLLFIFGGSHRPELPEELVILIIHVVNL